MDPNRQSHLIHLSPPPWAFLAHYRVQWPDEEDVEGFKETYLRYLGEVENLGYEFVQLVAEALGLPPDGLARFYDAPERMQHRSKVRFVRSSLLFLFFALAFARACVFFFWGGRLKYATRGHLGRDPDHATNYCKRPGLSRLTLPSRRTWGKETAGGQWLIRHISCLG